MGEAVSDFYGSAPEGKRIEYHEAKAERMTEDEQDLAAEIRRLDALLVQTRKDAMNELAAQVERAQQAERERDEAYREREVALDDFDTLSPRAEKLAEALERLAFEPTMKDYRSVARAALAEWEKP